MQELPRLISLKVRSTASTLKFKLKLQRGFFRGTTRTQSKKTKVARYLTKQLNMIQAESDNSLRDKLERMTDEMIKYKNQSD